MTLDPALQLTLRAALSLLLASAAWHKLRDVGSFRAAVENYRILPEVWVLPAAAGLVAAECGLAAALWLPGVGAAASVGTAALLTMYAGAMTVTLRRGRHDVDCGCAGPAGQQWVRPALVARNAALIAAAGVAALPAADRALGWIDAATVFLSTAVAACLYVAIDGLLAHGPRIAALARLRRPETRGA